MPVRKKGVYIGAPACFLLEQAARHVAEAFECYSGKNNELYVVGSCLERPDFRDVDVRLMINDIDFAKHFPNAGQHWEHDAKWLLLTTAISQWMSKQTGLNIDFQFQPVSHANEHHHGIRNAIGLRYVASKEETSDGSS